MHIQIILLTLMGILTLLGVYGIDWSKTKTK